jgi:cation diffusion facilitator family transporter
MQSNHKHSHHSHGAIDPTIVTAKRGIWAIKWSFIGLFLTALLQIVVVVLSNSVALLADTIHNLGDAATAIPLGIAFTFARLKPSKRFTYGYGRVEDLAGVAVVATILISAIVAGYEAVDRFFHPEQVHYLGAVAAASIIGFLGNEGVALFRINVGKEIGSAALIADGYHARADGWTSLAVLFGAVGVWLGYPLADPIVGAGITVTILIIVWESSKAVFIRMLDGVEPEVLEEIIHTAHHIEGVTNVGEIRARWIGHRLHAELNVAVHSHLSLAEGHEVAKEVRHQLLHHLRHLGDVIVHIDPEDKVGETHHRIVEHSHDGLPTHSH